MSYFSSATRGDYLAAASRRREAHQQREKEFRAQPCIISRPGQVYGWTDLYASHPDNENAPQLPEIWRYGHTFKSWWCWVRNDEADQVERQARAIFGIEL